MLITQVTVWIVIIKGRYAGMNKIGTFGTQRIRIWPQLHQSTFTEIGNEYISVLLNQLKLLGLRIKSNAIQVLPRCHTARRSDDCRGAP